MGMTCIATIASTNITKKDCVIKQLFAHGAKNQWQEGTPIELKGNWNGQVNMASFLNIFCSQEGQEVA